MDFRQDYILRQIEKMVQMVCALISNRKTEKTEQQSDVDAALSELTGFDKKTFAKLNLEQIDLVLSLLQDDNKRALASVLLWHKDKIYYRPCYEGLLQQVNRLKLNKDVQTLVDDTFPWRVK